MAEKTIIETILQFYPQAQAVYLFGSYGTDSERTDSDIDIALLLPFSQAKQEPALSQSPCKSALEAALGRIVDLINLRMANTVFQNEILNTARLLLIQDEAETAGFEMTVLSAYQKLTEERREILESFYQTKRAYQV